MTQISRESSGSEEPPLEGWRMYAIKYLTLLLNGCDLGSPDYPSCSRHIFGPGGIRRQGLFFYDENRGNKNM